MTVLASRDHEAYVAHRFDTLEARFKNDVGANDYRLQAILDRLGPVDGLRILDLGCGKGRFAKHLAEQGASVVGLDLSGAMISQAEGIARVIGSARALPFPDRTFDAVVAIEVFEHLIDVRGALKEARRVLRDGGCLVVVDKNAASVNAERLGVPNLLLKWVDERRGRWMYPADGPVRERWFRPSALKRLMTDIFDGADVQVDYLLSSEESVRPIFRRWPALRRMAAWSVSTISADQTGVAQ